MRTDKPGAELTRRSLLFGSLALAGILTAAPLTAHPAKSTLARTRSGKVRGVLKNGCHHFRGIPYGADTSGSGRFMPPRREEAWTGERDATAYGHRAPQLPQPPAFAPFQEIPIGEDCLVVNVWSRGIADGAKRPVMVWMHPGGFKVGTGADYTGDGTLTLKEDVVLVEVNHRLGVFGYLHLGDHDPKFSESGCAGMLDLVAALEWVRDNAAAFGGDAGNVTIFGESGGGAKVMTLMAMPSAAGLFHRAISESGFYLKGVERSTAKSAAETLWRNLEIPVGDVRALQRAPVDKLLKAAEGINSGPRGFSPTVGTRSLPHHPFDPTAPKISADVPYIIGVNRDETVLLRGVMSPDRDRLFSLSEQGLKEQLAKEYGQLSPETLEQLIEAYQHGMPNSSPSDRYFRITSDEMMRGPSILAAERKAMLGAAPAYLYYFTWAGATFMGHTASHHGTEQAFTFDRFDDPTSPIKPTPQLRILADQMRGAWGAFARTGNPNHSGMVEWSLYNTSERPTMVFDTPTKLVSDPEAKLRLAIQPLL